MAGTLLTADDELRVEVNQLRAELARLRPIADDATYLHGPQGCVAEEPGDEECDEYFDADGNRNEDVERCSHVEERHATYADTAARLQLEEVLVLLRASITGGADLMTLLEELDTGLYNVAHYVADISPAGVAIAQQEPYRSIVAAEWADYHNEKLLNQHQDPPTS